MSGASWWWRPVSALHAISQSLIPPCVGPHPWWPRRGRQAGGSGARHSTCGLRTDQGPVHTGMQAGSVWLLGRAGGCLPAVWGRVEDVSARRAVASRLRSGARSLASLHLLRYTCPELPRVSSGLGSAAHQLCRCCGLLLLCAARLLILCPCVLAAAGDQGAAVQPPLRLWGQQRARGSRCSSSGGSRRWRGSADGELSCLWLPVDWRWRLV